MGTEARASICSGTKMHPMPIPWTRRGHASAQKSLLERDVRHEQGREPVHEHAEAQEPALIDAAHEAAHDQRA